jgi:hypothetical protein
VLAAAGLCLVAFLGNRIVTWTMELVGLSQFKHQVSFALHVLGTVAFVYGAMLICEAYGAARKARAEPVEPADTPSADGAELCRAQPSGAGAEGAR